MGSRTRILNQRWGGERCGSKLPLGTAVSLPSYLGSWTCSDELHPGPPYRSGGPLSISKLSSVRLGRSSSIYAFISTGSQSGYQGYFAAVPYFPSVVPFPQSLSGWGAIGWNRTFPLHPVYNMGVSLIELKDFHGMISHTKTVVSDLAKRGFSFSATRRTFGDFVSDLKKGPKYIADNYLNLSFGWLPFMQDFAAMLNYRENLLKKLAWLKSHNGKSVRRRITLDSGGFSENIARTLNNISSMAPVLSDLNLYAAGNGTMSLPIKKSYDNKIWYVAKYRYYIPELADGKAINLRDHRRLAANLYGIAFDPSIIYKVIPWTWLLDWFGNIGTVLQNIYFRARYHVVAEYAYVMSSEKYIYEAPGYIRVHSGTRTGTSPAVWSGPDMSLSCLTTTGYIFKAREVANPYGFGITYKSLSAYQWSILAALGLSRRGKTSAPRT